MYWHEDDYEETTRVPDDVVDVLFSIDCKRLPVDHAYAGSQKNRSDRHAQNVAAHVS